MELEHKFLLEREGTPESVLLSARTLGFSARQKTVQNIIDTYYDTAEGALLQAGCLKRIRKCEGERLYTEKKNISQGDGRFLREETNLRLTGNTMPEALCASGMGAVLTVTHERRRYDLTCGVTVVELAYEAVTYSRDGITAGPEYQIELELKSPTGSGKLASLAAVVGGRGGVVPMNESKLQRGLRLTARS
ncbi:MAG: CYTH domain-containing protein [Oscillospiraceae bacterium]